MTRSKLALSLYASLSWSLGIPAVFAQPLDRSQIQVIRDTAAFICNTVTEARGKKTALQIEGDIKAQLGGLVGKVTGASGLSGKGAMTIEEFEGLSRDATAAALQAAQGCRERVFNKMFDRLAQLSRPAAIRPPGNRAPPSSKTDGNGFVLNANGEKTCYTEMLYTPSVSGPNLISIPGKKIVKRCWHVSGAWVPDNVGPGQEPRQLPPRALNSDEIRTLVYIYFKPMALIRRTQRSSWATVINSFNFI